MSIRAETMVEPSPATTISTASDSLMNTRKRMGVGSTAQDCCGASGALRFRESDSLFDVGAAMLLARARRLAAFRLCGRASTRHFSEGSQCSVEPARDVVPRHRAAHWHGLLEGAGCGCAQGSLSTTVNGSAEINLTAAIRAEAQDLPGGSGLALERA